jgi:phage tail sheath gpL-like
VLSVTTKGLGVIGGQLDVRSSYSVRAGFTTSPAVTVAIALTAPTGLPNLSGVAGISEGFEFVVNPYTDDNSIAAVSDYLCSQWTGGSNGRAYGVRYGDVSSSIAFGQNANNALLSYMAVDGALTPSYLESASYGCLAYRQLNCQSPNIGASLTGLAMPAMLAPEVADRFSNADKAALVEAGVGYFNVNRANDVTVGRAVTTYTVADNGTLDVSLRDVNRPAMIACISRFLRDSLTAKYTGYSFRRDGVVGRGSDKVATVTGIRNYIIGLAQQLSDRNLIQDLEGFVRSLSVVFDEDTGCVAITVDPELVQQFCCATITLRTI